MSKPRTLNPEVGQRFGYGTFVSEALIPYQSNTRSSDAVRTATLECDCGEVYSIPVKLLYRGMGTHCGCRKRAKQLERLEERLADAQRKHIQPLLDAINTIRSAGPIAGLDL